MCPCRDFPMKVLTNNPAMWSSQHNFVLKLSHVLFQYCSNLSIMWSFHILQWSAELVCCVSGKCHVSLCLATLNHCIGYYRFVQVVFFWRFHHSTHFYFLFLALCSCRKLCCSTASEILCSGCKEKEDWYVLKLYCHQIMFWLFFFLAFHPNIFFLPGPESQFSDLPPTMLKMDYAAVPLIQT